MKQSLIISHQHTHIAIMKKTWGLTDKILLGQKTIESRWYKNKSQPWDQIFPGDTIYFKDSSGPVRAKAKVYKVDYFNELNHESIIHLLNKIKMRDLGLDEEITEDFLNHIKGKHYCILIHFNQVQSVKPFNINKSGFGTQTAWMIVDDINKVKIS